MNYRWNGDQFKREFSDASAKGLQAAAVFYHARCKQEVNRGNTHRHKSKLTAKQSAARGGQKTATVYEDMKNQFAGQPPFKRTGFGLSNIVWEYNGDEKDPRVRIGVRANAIYMGYLEIGTSRIKPRPWLVSTLQKYWGQIRGLALSGWKK